MSGKREDPVALDDEEDEVPSSDAEEREKAEAKRDHKGVKREREPEPEESDDDATVLPEEEEEEDKKEPVKPKKAKQMPLVYQMHSTWKPGQSSVSEDSPFGTFYNDELHWNMFVGKDGILNSKVDSKWHYHSGLEAWVEWEDDQQMCRFISRLDHNLNHPRIPRDAVIRGLFSALHYRYKDMLNRDTDFDSCSQFGSKEGALCEMYRIGKWFFENETTRCRGETEDAIECLFVSCVEYLSF